jgi:hypothetical protein
MMPNYLNLDIFPTINTLPAGTFVTIKVQGANAIMGTTPQTGDTGLRTYITRNGVIQQAELDALDGRRFFRVQFANTTNNVVPFINGFLLGYSFF